MKSEYVLKGLNDVILLAVGSFDSFYLLHVNLN